MIDVMFFWWKMGIKLLCTILIIIVESYVLDLACLSKAGAFSILCMSYQFSNLILSWAWLDIRGRLRGNVELGLYFKVGWWTCAEGSKIV